jgi:hypothetical protein
MPRYFDDAQVGLYDAILHLKKLIQLEEETIVQHIISIISYTDIPVGAQVFLLLLKNETVLYRLDENPYLLLKSYSTSLSYYKGK